jgi:hypothetical protein
MLGSNPTTGTGRSKRIKNLIAIFREPLLKVRLSTGDLLKKIGHFTEKKCIVSVL